MQYVEYEKDPGWQYLRLDPAKAPMPDWFKTYDSKKSVWVPDQEEGYLAAEIKSTKGDIATVKTCKGTEVNVKKDLCQEMNPAKFERAEDMSNLTFLNDASVLANLRSRYGQMLIYTYSGLFCVVINPYKRLPIYTDSVCKMYMGKRKNEMPPHLFAASDEAYRNMIQDRENQSMLITGESGAGKTENTKKVIAYFAVVGSTQAAPPAATAKKEASLEEQIVQTNPVLESFGNAKTVRNNNSSRFGKFIRIHFDKTGKLSGGDIEHYLLEKSRAIKQNPGERCYHIFYQLHSGFRADMKKMLFLDHEPKYYHFISQGELVIDGMDDKEEAKATDEAFDILGFTQREKDEVYKITAALMHMGEMKFKQRGEQAEPEDDKTEAKHTCALFGVDAEAYLTAVTKPRVKVGNEWVNKGQTAEQVSWGIGAMTKGIYARLFDWLVKRCNKSLDKRTADRDFFIGVLDIAGFEIFDYNSFEQLWINFVNEKLQQFFNHHMFVLEQEEYQREGIQWEFIDFGLDLAATIELLEKPMGIISMLDEECIVPKATDLTYAQKMEAAHLGKHPSYEKPKPPKGKQAEAHFALKHYAGTVRYNVTAWLEKNKDPLNDSCVATLKASKENELLVCIWQDYLTQEEQAAAQKAGGGGKKGKSGSMMTVSMMYRESLNNLMTMLQKTHPHFIRCLIPNELKKSGLLDAALVLNQLTCNGVLEGIRICRKGFPNRTQHHDFKQRYSILAAEAIKGIDDDKSAVAAIMNHLVTNKMLQEENFRVGHTKVFFKAGVLAHMEDLRDAKLGAIFSGLQAKIRSNNTLREKETLMKQRKGMLALQRNIASWLVTRTWDWFLLFGKLRPNLKCNKGRDELDKLKKKMQAIEEEKAAEDLKRKELEATHAKLLAEKNELFIELQQEMSGTSTVEDRLKKLETQKKDLERQANDMEQRLNDQENRAAEIERAKNKVQADLENYRRQVAQLEANVQKNHSETLQREEQIKNLQDEMANQDELIAKLNKEKKHQDELNRKLADDFQAEEDKMNQINKQKAKLEQKLDEIEDNLEREKRLRADTEKVQRKIEGDLRLAQEQIEEMNRRKHEAEGNMKKKEQELNALNSRLEDEQMLVAKLQKQIKEQQAHLEELQEELDAEKQSRSRAEKQKSEVQRELDELSERLEEAGGATAAQVEINKKREAELAKLRRDLEEANQSYENELSALRKKHNDSVVEVGEQLDQIQKSKAKLDKEKASLQREIDDLHSQYDQESKGKQNNEKLAKQYELQLAELQNKHDEQARHIADFTSLKSRLTNENAELGRQLEAAESQINAMNRLKQQLTSQYEEAKATADEEAKERQGLQAQLRNYEHECNSIREQIEEQVEARAEAVRQLSAVNAEIQQWRAKFEYEGLSRTDELEDAKKRLNVRVQELLEQIEQANLKIASLEKARHRLANELEDAHVDVDRANSYVSELEKKQKGFDKIIDEWRRKFDDLHAELEASQRDNRNLGTEAFKLKNAQTEFLEQLEGTRRENRNLAQELKDLSDQLSEGGKSVHELQKLARRLELEKEELQAAYDEAEAALEAEESKVLRAQIEVSQIRAEIEKRIQEKEEEFDNSRKNHQRALDSMQASLESEAKGRAELTRIKKKLEADINELEIALEQANKANSDAQKTIKMYQEKIKELQTQFETEQHETANAREQLIASEKRCATMHAEKEEIAGALSAVERARKQVEADAAEARDQLADLVAQNSSLGSVKRQLESELMQIHGDVDETLNHLKTSEEQSKRAQMDAARLADELRQEQEHALQVDRMRRGLESQLKEMQMRLDEAEQAALKGGQKVVAKLEQRVRDLEHELDSEQRRHADSQKNLAKQERSLKDLQFAIDENKKNYERTQELVEKLQQKIKTYKKGVDEAEEIAATNLAKYRQIQQQVDEAAERADVAENSLAKLRAKYRTGGGGDGPMTSASSPNVLMRSSTRARASASNLLNF